MLSSPSLVHRKGRKTLVSLTSGPPHTSWRLELPQGCPTRKKQISHSQEASQGRGGLCSKGVETPVLFSVLDLKSVRTWGWGGEAKDTSGGLGGSGMGLNHQPSTEEVKALGKLASFRFEQSVFPEIFLIFQDWWRWVTSREWIDWLL